LAFLVLFWLLFLYLNPCCHPEGHGDADVARSATASIDAGVGSTRPVPAHDCDPADDHHLSRAALDVLSRAARGVGDLAWLAALLAVVAALSVAAAYRPAIRCREIRVRRRRAERDPCRTGRLLLLELCIARS
jgi:hypothetical protein